MKVYIGPYKNWFGPYQLAEKLLFWKDKYEDKTVHSFGEWLAYGSVEPETQFEKNGTVTIETVASAIERRRERPKTLVYKFLEWVDSKKKRKIEVRIDKYDTWSMDHTLAYIIVPMLKQLKATKHGAPHVDDKDVPKELRSTSTPRKKNDWDVDANHFKRWDWVLDEMIWTFEQELDNNDVSDVDYARMKNGYGLFGKYYQALWD